MVENLYGQQMEQVLKSQITAIEAIYSLQKEIYKAVMNKDWVGTQTGMTTLSNLALQFTTCDKKAAQIMSKISNGKNTEFSFKCFVNELSKEEGAYLSSLYRTLKEKVFLSQVENDVFNSYIKHTRSLVNGVFQVVAEERKSSTYTRTGSIAGADMSNLVVNRVF